MGFRLLRLHGYEVCADVFENFKSGGEFFCFQGQSTQAVTGMYNLYRASQLMFPGENILEDAAHFSANFLQLKRANNHLFDKWTITKDLPGEMVRQVVLPQVRMQALEVARKLEPIIWKAQLNTCLHSLNVIAYATVITLKVLSCKGLRRAGKKDKSGCRFSRA